MKSPNTAQLTFYGGVGRVTGANFLLETGECSLLVDCGLVQGVQRDENPNRRPFPYEPNAPDALLVTHAHIDHIGRIPKLVRDGFQGVIYSTPATKDLAEIMFEDSVGILAQEAEAEGAPPLYTEKDVADALSLWKTRPYHERTELSDAVSFTFLDAGHILGSAMVSLARGDRTLIFTGDLGNTPAPLLPETESIAGAHYLVTESVYGDREHEDVEGRRRMLADAVARASDKKGVLVIPAFSLERTQSLLYELNELFEDGTVPQMPVFLDSPLAIKLTEVYRKYTKRFKESVRADAAHDDIFNFKNLSFTETVAESKAIVESPNPKIIIAGSGMSDAGRVRHHEKHYLSDEKNTILLIGYQAAGTPGRKLQEGAAELSIFGETVPVRAEVRHIRGYSAHKDVNGLLDFVEEAEDTLEHVYATMGEPHASLFLAQRITDYLGVSATAPEAGDSVTLSF